MREHIIGPNGTPFCGVTAGEIRPAHTVSDRLCRRCRKAYIRFAWGKVGEEARRTAEIWGTYLLLLDEGNRDREQVILFKLLEVEVKRHLEGATR